METKRVKLQLKKLEADGTFVGRSAVFNNRDLIGDVVLPGAFLKTIKDTGGKYPLLDEHSLNVGVVEVEESEAGLETKGKLNLEVQAARELHSNMKFFAAEGLRYGMSFGFKPIPDKTELKGGTRYLKEVQLFEVTLTVLPLNPEARVTDVKSIEKKADFMTELDAEQIFAHRYQMMRALDTALSSMLWDDTKTTEEKVAAADESISQFRESCLEFVPKMCALMESRYKSALTEIEQKDGCEIISSERVATAVKNFRALLSGAAYSSDEPVDDHSALTARAESFLALFR